MATQEAAAKAASKRARACSVSSESFFLVLDTAAPGGSDPLKLPPPPCRGRAYESLLEAAKQRVSEAIKVNVREEAMRRETLRATHRQQLLARSGGRPRTSPCATGLRHSSLRRKPPVDKLENQLGGAGQQPGARAPADCASNQPTRPACGTKPARASVDVKLVNPMSTYFTKHHAAAPATADMTERTATNSGLLWSGTLSATAAGAEGGSGEAEGAAGGARPHGGAEAELAATLESLDARMAQLTCGEFEGGDDDDGAALQRTSLMAAAPTCGSGGGGSSSSGGGGHQHGAQDEGVRDQDVRSLRGKLGERAAALRERLLGVADDRPADWSADWRLMASRQQVRPRARPTRPPSLP
eukprot:2952864-Prymnesium_polylepis.1